MLNSATQDCTNWLGEAIQVLKHRALVSLADRKRRDQGTAVTNALLDAVSAGNLEQTEALLRAVAEHSGAGTLWSPGLMMSVISQLEENWQSDRRSYSDTIFAFWNVQRVLNHLESKTAWPLAVGGRIFLATSPGTQHTFGLSVVDNSFRLAGWDTQTFMSGDCDSILDFARTATFDVIGLSVGHDEGLDGLEDFLSVLRSKSRNHAVKIILGGNIFSQPVRQYDWLGADYIALSVESAMEYCSGVASIGLQRN